MLVVKNVTMILVVLVRPISTGVDGSPQRGGISITPGFIRGQADTPHNLPPQRGGMSRPVGACLLSGCLPRLKPGTRAGRAVIDIVSLRDNGKAKNSAMLHGTTTLKTGQHATRFLTIVQNFLPDKSRNGGVLAGMTVGGFRHCRRPAI